MEIKGTNLFGYIEAKSAHPVRFAVVVTMTHLFTYAMVREEICVLNPWK